MGKSGLEKTFENELFVTTGFVIYVVNSYRKSIFQLVYFFLLYSSFSSFYPPFFFLLFLLFFYFIFFISLFLLLSFSSLFFFLSAPSVCLFCAWLFLKTMFQYSVLKPCVKTLPQNPKVSSQNHGKVSTQNRCTVDSNDVV